MDNRSTNGVRFTCRWETVLRGVLLGVALLLMSQSSPHAQNGQVGRDDVLVGFHYGDMSNHEGRRNLDYPRNIWPFFSDYLTYLDDDMSKTSYADFWRWWYILERYKGDEKGLAELDGIVDSCLERGLKVKIDLAWSTWWTQDRDWEEGFKLPLGPQDIDDWTHLCDMLARRYRGRIAVWDLQGEANDLEHYWQGRKQEHVYDVYKRGYLVFKRHDPGALIGISGASPSVSLQKMDEWYWNNLKNCIGYYDNIPINFFADVADPYGGGINYYNSIRNMLDRLGETDVEVGMGETSVQWAETTIGAATDTLTIEKQSLRMNRMFGSLFTAGMNKKIMWATEFAPGGGHWPWRWGLRNYEDWWGIWPDSFKIPGTQIVSRYEGNDGTVVDLRPEWPRPADPYYPAWEVYCFWAQIAPAGVEAVRLPMSVDCGEENEIWNIASFHRAKNRSIALIYTENDAPLSITLDLAKTGWSDTTPLIIEVKQETIDFNTGEHECLGETRTEADIRAGSVTIDIPAGNGFTTIEANPASHAAQAMIEGTVFPDSVAVGQTVEGYIVFRNTGGDTWMPDTTGLVGWDDAGGTLRMDPMSVPRPVRPGETVALHVELPAQTDEGYYAVPVRLRDERAGWFGPILHVSYRVVDYDVPLNLIAHREFGHVRLQWLPPRDDADTVSYEIYRAPGFDESFVLLDTVTGTGYMDQTGDPDSAYYYHVVAVDSRGARSRPSNEDNAKNLGTRRILDAEIISHTVPCAARIGDVAHITITVRNTGKKTWETGNPDKVRYWLQSTQLWGNQDEQHIGHIELERTSDVKTGDEVSFTFPFVGPKTGIFDNHWIMYMEVPGNRKESKSGWEGVIKYAYFGTPLIQRTLVTGK